MQKLKKSFKNARTRDVFEQNIRKIQNKSLSLHQFSKPQTPKEKIKNMNKTKILFINTEVMPYLPEARMSSIGRQLPQGIQDAGHEIRTFMPRFGLINERRNQLHEVIRLSGMNLIINDTDHPLIIKVASIQQARMQVYVASSSHVVSLRRYASCAGNPMWSIVRDGSRPFHPSTSKRPLPKTLASEASRLCLTCSTMVSRGIWRTISTAR